MSVVHDKTIEICGKRYDFVGNPINLPSGVIRMCRNVERAHKSGRVIGGEEMLDYIEIIESGLAFALGDEQLAQARHDLDMMPLVDLFTVATKAFGAYAPA